MNLIMNYKLEKFWNIIEKAKGKEFLEWTINLKSFEIRKILIVL